MFEVEGYWCEGSSSEQQLHHALFGSQSSVKKRRKKSCRGAETTELQSQTQQELFTPDSPGAMVTDERVGRKRKTSSRTQNVQEREVLEEDGKLKRGKLDLEDDSNPDPVKKRTKQKKKRDKCTPKQSLPETSEKAQASPKNSKLHARMTSKMESARFRWINEQLYSTTGDEAKELFQNDPGLFSVYHRGFTAQVSKWPQDPLGTVIAYVKLLPADKVIADFGCGEARLSQSVPHTVHSFDLVAINEYVTACDMTHVPLPRESIDVAVFCLSLMGTNISDFIQEAKRVLRKNGIMKIIDIASRFSSLDGFISALSVYGFHPLKKRPLGKMFVDMEFKLVTKKSPSPLPEIRLKPCIYKRR